MGGIDITCVLESQCTIMMENCSDIFTERDQGMIR